MPLRFPCPECHESIEISEHLAGLHTQCPRCCGRILVPHTDRPAAEQITVAPPAPPAPRREEPAPAAPPDKLTLTPSSGGLFEMPRYADTPAPPGYLPPDDARFTLPRGGSAEGWGPVRVGLLLLQIGLGLLAAGFGVYLLSLLGLCAAGALRGRGVTAALGGALLAAGLLLSGFLLFLVGQGVCCAVPGRSGLRAFMIGALGCCLGSQILSVVHSISQVSFQAEEPFPQRQGRFNWGDFQGRPPGALGEPRDTVVTLFVLALFVAGHFLLAAFLQGVANYFDDQALIERAREYVRGLTGFVAVSVGLAVISCVPIIGLVAIALPLVVFIWGLILFVKLLGLLGRTRRTVAMALARL